MNRFKITLLSVLLGLAGCSAKPASQVIPSASASPATTASVAEEEDKFASALLEDGANHQAALQWLADTRDHIIWGKGDRDSLKAHFTELQKAGVKEAWACTRDFKGKQIAFCYIVPLPVSGNARASAFEIHNHFWASQTDDKEKLEVLRRTDVGQKYLMYNFD